MAESYPSPMKTEHRVGYGRSRGKRVWSRSLFQAPIADNTSYNHVECNNSFLSSVDVTSSSRLPSEVQPTSPSPIRSSSSPEKSHTHESITEISVDSILSPIAKSYDVPLEIPSSLNPRTVAYNPKPLNSPRKPTPTKTRVRKLLGSSFNKHMLPSSPRRTFTQPQSSYTSFPRTSSARLPENTKTNVAQKSLSKFLSRTAGPRAPHLSHTSVFERERLPTSQVAPLNPIDYSGIWNETRNPKSPRPVAQDKESTEAPQSLGRSTPTDLHNDIGNLHVGEESQHHDVLDKSFTFEPQAFSTPVIERQNLHSVHDSLELYAHQNQENAYTYDESPFQDADIESPLRSYSIRAKRLALAQRSMMSNATTALTVYHDSILSSFNSETILTEDQPTSATVLPPRASASAETPCMVDSTNYELNATETIEHGSQDTGPAQRSRMETSSEEQNESQRNLGLGKGDTTGSVAPKKTVTSRKGPEPFVIQEPNSRAKQTPSLPTRHSMPRGKTKGVRNYSSRYHLPTSFHVPSIDLSKPQRNLWIKVHKDPLEAEDEEEDDILLLKTK